MCWIAAISLTVLICAAVFAVWASACVGSGVYLKALCRAHDGRRTVALTFDDGPDAVMTPRVLDVLREHGVRATFFVTGRSAERHPDIVRRIVNEGHAVGNHTWSHTARWTVSSFSAAVGEINRTQTAIERITGRIPALFRPPFGVTNPRIGRAVRAAGLQTVGWSIRSLDTFEGRDRCRVCRRICRRLRGGDVILLHDRCRDADILLTMLLASLRGKGYEVEPLDKLFDTDVYKN